MQRQTHRSMDQHNKKIFYENTITKFNKERLDLSMNDAGTTGHPQEKEKYFNLNFIAYTKIQNR